MVEPADLKAAICFSGRVGESTPQTRRRVRILEHQAVGGKSWLRCKGLQGRVSVKQGVEARTEVVISRVVWAVGYHPAVRLPSPEWTLVRDGKTPRKDKRDFDLNRRIKRSVGVVLRRLPFSDARVVGTLRADGPVQPGI